MLSAKEDHTQTLISRDLMGVIESVRAIVGAQVAGVALYDAGRGELETCTMFAEGDPIISRMRLADDKAPVRFFSTADGLWVSNNPLEDPRLDHHYVQKYAVKNAVIVPLEYRQERIGNLHLANKIAGDFTTHDCEIIRLLAFVVATLVENHYLSAGIQHLLSETKILYEHEKKAAAQLKEANRRLENQTRRLSRMMKVQERLLSLIFHEADLQTTADTLEDLIGNPVGLFDASHRLLACSKTFSQGDIYLSEAARTGTLPGSFREHRVVRDHMKWGLANKSVVRIPPVSANGEDLTKFFVPVFCRDRIAGYICASERNAKINEDELLAIQQAATVYGLYLLREKAVHETEAKLKGGLVNELIAASYPDEEAITKQAQFLGHNLNAPHFLVLIEPDTVAVRGKNRDTAVEVSSRLAAMASEVFPRGEGISVSLKGAGLVALVAEELIPLRWPGATIVQEVCRHVKKGIEKRLHGYTVTIGISDRCTCPGDYTNAYRQARQTVDVARCRGENGAIVAWNSLGIVGMLTQAEDPEALLKFAKQQLGPLLEYDRTKGTKLVETLKAFLDHNGHLAATAAALYIHTGTLRYRLEKIKHLLGYELDGPRNLDLHFAVRILEVVGMKTTKGPFAVE
ncbi:MAG: GAF domain-containing protein [Clostridia bacterium]|nr:MAG: GAF domain-containing protein [Clostridia bacterium]